LLIPGGTLVLVVPDLTYCAQKWLNNQTSGQELDDIFGMQTYDGGLTDADGEIHHTGFSQSTLNEYLVQAGFDVISNAIIWTHNMNSIDIFGRKN